MQRTLIRAATCEATNSHAEIDVACGLAAGCDHTLRTLAVLA
jgi:hypothetical protein